MKLCVIIPFHDPRWLSNVHANLWRLGKPEHVFVLNGAASRMPVRPVPSTYCGMSHADGVNAGASWARENGFTHALCTDSDDWYGPGYIEQAKDALLHADFCGKRSVRVSLNDGTHLFEREGGEFLGGTLGFSIAAFLPMRAIFQDDTQWCRDMRASGAVGFDTGPDSYIYVRQGQNAHWRANDVIVRKSWGPSVREDGQKFAVPTDAEVYDAMGR